MGNLFGRLGASVVASALTFAAPSNIDAESHKAKVIESPISEDEIRAVGAMIEELRASLVKELGGKREGEPFATQKSGTRSVVGCAVDGTDRGGSVKANRDSMSVAKGHYDDRVEYGVPVGFESVGETRGGIRVECSRAFQAY